jgi:hypothetical protein
MLQAILFLRSGEIPVYQARAFLFDLFLTKDHPTEHLADDGSAWRRVRASATAAYGLNSCLSLRIQPAYANRFVARIFGDHEPHLGVRFLPFPDKISGSIIRHHFDPLLCQNSQRQLSIPSFVIGSMAGSFRERLRDTVKFRDDAAPDPCGPFDLIYGAG